ncbi:MAG: Ig-like domain-containing protein [Clostridiales bacterium]|nr:Ig-like domain-containing protein [Clostridiales bacterium]
MRKFKIWILCCTLILLLASTTCFTAFAASNLTVTSNKTLTAKFNKYDNVTVCKNSTLTLAKRKGEPVGLEINKSLVVEEGGKITGDGILIFDKNATYSGITLYYKYKGELKKLPPNRKLDQLSSDEDYRPSFYFDSKNGIYVLNAEFTGGDPFAIEISRKHVKMLIKDKQQLDLSGLTEGVTWKSSKKAVATVSKTGKVTAKKLGTAVITATYEGKKYSCEVEVVKKGLNQSNMYMETGNEFYLFLNGTKVKAVASSDKTVAKITKKLVVTAVSPGECTITVRGTDGIRYKCKITVGNPGEQQPNDQPPTDHQPQNQQPQDNNPPATNNP